MTSRDINFMMLIGSGGENCKGEVKATYIIIAMHY